MLTALDYNILITLAYTDQFQYPLSKAEIEQRLINLEKFFAFAKKNKDLRDINNRLKKKNSAIRKSFNQSLKKLINKNLIIQQGKYYAIKGSNKLFTARQEKSKFITEKKQTIKNFVKIAQKIPFIKAAVITGSTAMNNAEAEADIDFLIITARRRLWLGRLILILIAALKHKRPNLGKSIKNSWDFNFWLSENQLALAKNKQGFYQAYEAIQAKWVFDRDDCQNKFYQKNLWINQYLPNSLKLKKQKKLMLNPNGQKKFFSRKIRRLIQTTLDTLNSLSFKLQTTYRFYRHGAERVKLSQAHLHKEDSKKLIYQKWLSSINRIIAKQN
ncbi:MAG: hypothetical protein PVJ09_01895 [Candidatus Woesebacteria bacterium]|jgi:hypothetical protein